MSAEDQFKERMATWPSEDDRWSPEEISMNIPLNARRGVSVGDLWASLVLAMVFAPVAVAEAAGCFWLWRVLT